MLKLILNLQHKPISAIRKLCKSEKKVNEIGTLLFSNSMQNLTDRSQQLMAYFEGLDDLSEVDVLQYLTLDSQPSHPQTKLLLIIYVREMSRRRWLAESRMFSVFLLTNIKSRNVRRC